MQLQRKLWHIGDFSFRPCAADLTSLLQATPAHRNTARVVTGSSPFPPAVRDTLPLRPYQAAFARLEPNVSSSSERQPLAGSGQVEIGDDVPIDGGSGIRGPRGMSTRKFLLLGSLVGHAAQSRERGLSA